MIPGLQFSCLEIFFFIFEHFLDLSSQIPASTYVPPSLLEIETENRFLWRSTSRTGLSWYNIILSAERFQLIYRYCLYS